LKSDRQPGRRLSRVLLTATLLAVACASILVVRAAIVLVNDREGPTTYGPGSGTLTGVIRPCTLADLAGGAVPASSPIVTAYAQNLAGRTVASQRLPHLTRGVRYRLRLLAGSYTMNALADGPEADSSGVVVIVTAHRTTTVNFTGAGGCV
jgi:hypothetical protein